MNSRPEKGLALFYHRDSAGHSEVAPPQYVEWARKKAAELGLTFTGTADTMKSMMAQNQSVNGDLYLDYGISGNHLSRPGFDALRKRALSDNQVSHIFVSRRDRMSRPDNPIDAMAMEIGLRKAGLTIVMMDGKTLPPVATGSRIETADLITSMIDYEESGKFRRSLAEKLIHAKIRLAQSGFSIGGEPLYGFRRWLCAEDGTPKRELEEHEIVKLPGHHVIWLPTATDELKILNRILDEIETIPASKIARRLNDEGIPAPNAERVRTVNGVRQECSGMWNQNTITNLARHPLLIALWEYGKRSMGDQLRFTKEGPRTLNAEDYRADGKLKIIANPAEQQIRTEAKSDPLITSERFSKIQAILDERGKHLRGKPRARGDAPNTLGGRIHDLNCGWPMYRLVRRKKWHYRCSLYQNSECQCCENNAVDGATATRFVLYSLKQRVLPPSIYEKLKSRLRQMAEAEQGIDETEQLRQALQAKLTTVERNLKAVGKNLARAEDDDVRQVTLNEFRELKAEAVKLEHQIAQIVAAPDRESPEQEVERALCILDRIREVVDTPSPSFAAIAEAFRQTNVQLYLKFRPVSRGRQTVNVSAGGNLTFGSTPPPVPMHEGPTNRAFVRKTLAAGESLSPVPVHGAPGNLDSGQNVGWSANVKRALRRFDDGLSVYYIPRAAPLTGSG